MKKTSIISRRSHVYRGGLEKSIERGQSIGCTTIQIFTKSNRQWHAKTVTQEQIDLFKSTLATSNIDPVVAHATYLINIASGDQKIAHASVNALTKELATCDALGIPYLVLHPGASTSSAPQDALDRAVANLDIVLKNTEKTMIALETMAGQGSTLCASFEQLAYILKNSAYSQKIGICFDTCHAFAAGYDFRDSKDYEHLWKTFDSIIGLEKLKVIHVNDSQKELGCKVDRHQHIGKGKIGLKAFELLFNDSRFFDIPKILETPKAIEAPFTEDKMNMATICGLLSKETKKKLDIES